MRRMATPSALSRTLCLQRANARAKSSRADSFSDQPSQLSQRIDLLFTSISNSSNNAMGSRNIIDTQSKPLNEPSKQLALQVDDGNHNVIKRSLSADIPSGYKACFSSLSERIDRGVDLWDRDFSSMSSYASDHDGFLCGLRTRLNSDASILCESAKDKEDACSKSSWSEDSLVDAIQREDGASSIAYRMQGLGIECTSGSPLYVADHKLQCGVGRSLRMSDNNNFLLCREDGAEADEGSKIVHEARFAGSLDEYLISRGGYLTQCLQVGASGTHSSHDAAARDAGDEETSDEGHSSIIGGSNRPEEHGEGGVINRSNTDDNNIDRMRVGSRRDYNKLEKELIMSSERGEEEITRCKRDKSGCKKRENHEEEVRKRVGERRGALRGLPADSVAVELVSVNVVEDFRESMYEMMMEKDMEEEWEDSSMQDLLNCYLLLNPSQLHGIIREVFSGVWIDIIMTLR